MKENIVRLLKKEDLNQILKLTKQLNENISVLELESMQIRMFDFEHYKCFGLFEKNKLIGLSSGWITIKLYSGKQLEIDNLIIDNSVQSKGYGRTLMNEIESWAKANNCKTIELNTYIQNDRSHKFYFNQGYSILGFHFQKCINKP